MSKKHHRHQPLNRQGQQTAQEYVSRAFGDGNGMTGGESPMAKARRVVDAEQRAKGQRTLTDLMGDGGASEGWNVREIKPSGNQAIASAARQNLTSWQPAAGGQWRRDYSRDCNPERMPKFEFHTTGLDRIWAGRNPTSGNNVRDLWGIGITHIVDLREPEEWTAPRLGEAALRQIEEKGMTRLHLPVRDAYEPTAAQITEAVDFIEDALAEPNAKVYVHCRAGRSRTAAILLAYAAKYPIGTVGRADAFLKFRYRLYAPLYNQVLAVRHWHEPLLEATAPKPTSTAVHVRACDGCARLFEVAKPVVAFTCRECVAALFGGGKRLSAAAQPVDVPGRPAVPPRLVVPVDTGGDLTLVPPTDEMDGFTVEGWEEPEPGDYLPDDPVLCIRCGLPVDTAGMTPTAAPVCDDCTMTGA